MDENVVVRLALGVKVRLWERAAAMTATVTVADTGNACEYVVQAKSTG